MEQQKSEILNDIRTFIIVWNNKFIYDRMYRQKYNIAFNSPQHRALSPIDIFIDIMEDKLVQRHFDKKVKRDELLKDYKNTGEFLLDKDTNMTEDEKEDMFEKIMQGIKKSSE
jgi:hypothetical protein